MRLACPCNSGCQRNDCFPTSCLGSPNQFQRENWARVALIPSLKQPGTMPRTGENSCWFPTASFTMPVSFQIIQVRVRLTAIPLVLACRILNYVPTLQWTRFERVLLIMHPYISTCTFLFFNPGMMHLYLDQQPTSLIEWTSQQCNIAMIVR
ncbi:uncharacterized protein EI90DRAFT_236691 [Cantharellus anzutake]|uniref:uncharacterized protein n=1 Tax=Cantharellus anzutake TaxID=1750568 RepID=UPI001908D71C|nr:uncharacterized protein EI90DRAFT_236691 [Cantharellus anzutake]KAF8316446.1 hypothetical protein EI90DRAFT_236691 [Cantharellus anzutake]